MQVGDCLKLSLFLGILATADKLVGCRDGLIESMAWSADPYVVGSAMNFNVPQSGLTSS